MKKLREIKTANFYHTFGSDCLIFLYSSDNPESLIYDCASRNRTLKLCVVPPGIRIFANELQRDLTVRT